MCFSMSGLAHFIGVQCDMLATKKKGKKRGRKTYQVSPYMGLILLAVQQQRSLFGLKRVVMRRNHGRDMGG